MNIDPTTGLPALPEGYFWEVRRHMESIHAGNAFSGYSKPWDVPAGYEVCIMVTRTCTVAHEGTITRPKVRWWEAQPVMTTPTTYTEEKVTTLVKSKRIIDPAKVAANNEAYEFDAQAGWDVSITYPPTYYDHITPELVLEFATKCYTEWQAVLEDNRVAKAEREVSEALVGVYPPKALP